MSVGGKRAKFCWFPIFMIYDIGIAGSMMNPLSCFGSTSFEIGARESGVNEFLYFLTS